MSKSSNDGRFVPPSIRIDGAGACVEVLDGEEGLWVIIGMHMPTGRRFVFLEAAPSAEQALESAKEQADEIDTFGDRECWVWCPEFYDVEFAPDPDLYDDMPEDKDDASDPWPALTTFEALPVHLTDEGRKYLDLDKGPKFANNRDPHPSTF
jgi:hypothetical protein